MAKLSSILLQNTPVRTKRQTHILQLWKNSNSRVTSAHKTFLLYLTFPVCASPQPGHQWNPFQQLLHLALSQASRDPYWRNTNKCKQPRLALHFWPVRNSLPSVPPITDRNRPYTEGTPITRSSRRSFGQALTPSGFYLPQLHRLQSTCQTWTETKRGGSTLREDGNCSVVPTERST